MSKLTDYLSNFLPFPQEDKRYIKERSDELVTSFLIKNALKKGTYLSKELEHQNLNERVQFRASRDHAVILGTMLKRVSQNRRISNTQADAHEILRYAQNDITF